jgi:hypothetical protein
MQEVNAHTAGRVCLPVSPSAGMIQLKKCWADLDKISHGLYAICVYPKIVLFEFLQLVILTWRTNKPVE